MAVRKLLDKTRLLIAFKEHYLHVQILGCSRRTSDAHIELFRRQHLSCYEHRPGFAAISL
jgi:hypothetical protein